MENSKISFGFSKINKKVTLVKPPDPAASKKVEYIQGFEANQVKYIGKDPNEIIKEKLVIPLSSDQKSTPITRLIEKRSQIQQKIELERKLKDPEGNEKKFRDPEENEIIKEVVPENNVKVEINETLEQRAAREILESLNAKDEESTASKVFAVPLHPDELPLDGAKEPSLNDYEDIPIADFGKAMLRGMGWKDEDESNSKKVDIPTLRPKGMGLGADKMIKPQPLLIAPGKEEVLEIKRNAFVKILAGKHKDLYGQIEGFDGDVGRVVVKMAIGGTKVSINGFLMQPVGKQEYAKYAKILNSTKYEEYKNNDGEKKEQKANVKEEKTVKKEKEECRSNSTERYRKREEEKSRRRSPNNDKYPRDRYRKSRSTSPAPSSSRNHRDYDRSRRSVSNEGGSSKKSSSKSHYSRKDKYYRKSSEDSDEEKSNRKYHDRARSRSKDKYKSRRSSDSSGSDEYRSKKKSSKSSKKSSKHRKNHSPEYSSSRNRYYSSDSDSNEKKHKKKTKRSKKQRSRS